MLDAPQAPDALARPPIPAAAIDPPAAPAHPVAADALFAASQTLLPVLEAGRPLDAATLRDAMTRAFGASDAEGGWLWKDAYEAAEAAVVIFMQRYGRGMRRNAGAGGPRRMLAMLEAVAALEPSHTRRSEEQVRLQQFSTPLPLAYAALQAAAIRPGDVVLEPSAGTGLLAVMAQCALGDRAAGALHLNEYARVRARLLTQLFPEAVVTAFNAETIADRLRDVRPTVVLMNPPFSATPGVDRITRDADLRHVRSAASMLPPGGRLVTITSAHCAPGDTVGRLDPPARCVFTMAIDGRAYARRGTGFDTRLTVLERGAGPAVELDGTARARRCRRAARCRHRPDAEAAADRAHPGPGRTRARPVRQAGGTEACNAARSQTRIDPGHPPVPRLGAGFGAGRRDRADRARRYGYRCFYRHRPLRALAAGRGAGSGRRRASDPAGAVRRHGRRVPSGTGLAPDDAGAGRHRRHAVRRPAGERRIGRGSPFPAPGGAVPDRLPVGDRPPLPRRREGRRGRRRHLPRHPGGRDAVGAGALPPGLDAGRRHRLRQGTPGRRHHPRPPAARAETRPLALAVGQAAGGRAPRLDGARRPGERRHPARQFPAGDGDTPRRGHPVRDVRHAALAVPPGKALAAGADRRMARRLAGRGRPSRLRRGRRVRRGARHGERGGVEVRAWRDQALPAGKGRAALAERAAGRPYRLRVGHRRDHGAGPRLCRTSGLVGRRRDAVREARRVRFRHGGRRRCRHGSRRTRPEGAGPVPGPRARL